MNQYTDNKKFMNNIITYHSNIIQMLVQNYLEYENKEKDVYIYPELINDIDVFNKRIHDKVFSKYPMREEPKSVQAFLNIIKDEECDYVNTYEVKYESDAYIFIVKNIMQIVECPFRYPDNTIVELILIPSDKEAIDKEDPLYKRISEFNKIKEMYSEMNEDYQFIFMNVLKNNKGSLKEDINVYLESLINKISKGKVIPNYKNEISKDEFAIMSNNFTKIQIRLLSINDLISIPITKEFIHKTLFPFV